MSQQAPHSRKRYITEDDLAQSVCIDNHIVSGLGVDDVGIEAIATRKHIVAHATKERVITVAPIQCIISVGTSYFIVTISRDIGNPVLQITVQVTIQAEIQYTAQEPATQVVFILIEIGTARRDSAAH
ncbi:hypothetical protein CR47_0328230 [Ralstonia solanacearum]|nr:hypothetical protein KR99_24240 [Ralstonia solanacearum]KLT21157.1 hypothetical protein CR47_0328230 [Ralstonia solanacearum]OCQ60494.1 hypothetical protein AR463_21405 [Ralstonia solanacearum]OCQ74652.1 hypothetical protein AR466_12965 [Ralstonia solanacearum]